MVTTRSQERRKVKKVKVVRVKRKIDYPLSLPRKVLPNRKAKQQQQLNNNTPIITASTPITRTSLYSRRRKQQENTPKLHRINNNNANTNTNNPLIVNQQSIVPYEEKPLHLALLDKIYKYNTKNSDLCWSFKEGDLPSTKTRQRNPNIRFSPCGMIQIENETGKKPERVSTVSEGYGETTINSVSKLLQLLESLPEDLRLGSHSSFVDIGSGFGKVVFHARLHSQVKRSVGIEYVSTRHQVAIETLEFFSQKQNIHEYTQALKGIQFFCGDATRYAPFQYTHIYMYDCIFNEDTWAVLAPQLNTSPFKILVSYRSKTFLTKRGLENIELIDSMKMNSTGKQSFTAHVYRKIHS